MILKKKFLVFVWVESIFVFLGVIVEEIWVNIKREMLGVNYLGYRMKVRRNFKNNVFFKIEFVRSRIGEFINLIFLFFVVEVFSLNFGIIFKWEFSL